MKFIVSSSALLSHLQATSRVISSKNSMAILDNFLFDLEGNLLTITTSDQETTMSTTIEVTEAEGKGLFAASAKMMLELLRELPEQPITFDINDENMEIFIYFQNGKYNLIGFNGEDYPQLAQMFSDAKTITMNAQDLMNGITRAIFAAADDELRPVMNGVFIDIHTDKVFFVASDSHKLVRFSIDMDCAGSEASFILPKKPANLLKTILGRENDKIEITFDTKNACFKLPNFVLNCRLIEGRFPNYASVIPQNNANVLSFDRSAFTQALRRVAVFASQANNLVKLNIQPNQVTISSQDLDFSTSAVESIPVSYSGESMNIGFKANYLIELLNNVVSDEVEVKLSDPSRAGLIMPTNNQPGEDLLMLLMPMMLSE